MLILSSYIQIVKLQLLLNLISVVVLLLPFSEIFKSLIILL